ncbi:MAG: hypothetical protein E6772_11510 [Dysgonomonas sp.]|nr:hypothetical protein [Dysgonomonas sp.]
MKKNILWGAVIFATTLLGFSSCSDDDDDKYISTIPPALQESTNGAYILSSGKMNSNTASLYYYDLSKTENKDAFEVFNTVNGISLGDVAQDMIVYGGKMYISMYNSGIIYVTDKNAKLLATIKDATNKLQPRYFDAGSGKIFVSLYDGYLARIDTTSLTIDKKIAVGPNPERVKIANNKIYVANSGGLNERFNNTISITDLNLTDKIDIEVALNPYELKTDKKGNLYLVSRGNYGLWTPFIPNSFQQINTTTDEVTVIDEGRSYSIFPEGNKIYMLDKGYDENKNPYSNFMYYDTNKKEIVEESFITDETVIKDANSLSIEPVSGDYYVSVANGTNNGDVYIFSKDGKFKSKFDTGSAYPAGVWFLKK